MLENLNTIDQSGIKALIKERVENPEKYVDTPLVIWRADIRDGNQEAILMDVFNEYNEGKTGRDRKWYKIASVRQMPWTKYDILDSMLHNIFVDKNNNEPYQGPITVYSANNSKRDTYRIGLMVIDPVLASLDYSRNPELLNKYHSVINSRKWDNIEITQGIPVVAYMCINETWFETPEAYPNAEQYYYFSE